MKKKPRTGKGQLLYANGAVGLTKLRRMLPKIFADGDVYENEVYDYGRYVGRVRIEVVKPGSTP